MFNNEVSKNYPVKAKRAGSNIVLDTHEKALISKVMKRYYEMDFISDFQDKKREKYYLVFAYHGDMSQSKIIEIKPFAYIIIDGVNESELEKIPQDGTYYFI